MDRLIDVAMYPPGSAYPPISTHPCLAHLHHSSFSSGLATPLNSNPECLVADAIQFLCKNRPDRPYINRKSISFCLKSQMNQRGPQGREAAAMPAENGSSARRWRPALGPAADPGVRRSRQPPFCCTDATLRSASALPWDLPAFSQGALDGPRYSGLEYAGTETGRMAPQGLTIEAPGIFPEVLDRPHQRFRALLVEENAG